MNHRQHMRRQSGILIPTDDVPKPLLCTCCNARFAEDERSAWQYHVGSCARAHLDDIREAGALARGVGTWRDEELWDPEYAAHQRKVGERMVRENDFAYKKGEK